MFSEMGTNVKKTLNQKEYLVGRKEELGYGYAGPLEGVVWSTESTILRLDGLKRASTCPI